MPHCEESIDLLVPHCELRIPVLVHPLRTEVHNLFARYPRLTSLRGVNCAGVPVLVHPLRREVPSAFFPLECASPRSSNAGRGS
jgi:hypothetical protein